MKIVVFAARLGLVLLLILAFKDMPISSGNTLADWGFNLGAFLAAYLFGDALLRRVLGKR